jgi:hypothetical protein
MTPQPAFEVGDVVAAVALPEGWPHPRPRIAPLVVKQVEFIECRSLESYYRVLAEGVSNTRVTVEGAERFFEHTEA